jgi:hypothetical protein
LSDWYNDSTFAPPAFYLNPIGHEPRDQAAAMTTQRHAVFGRCFYRFTIAVFRDAHFLS